MIWTIPAIMTSSFGSASSSSLLTGLVSYWKLDETSGNAIDELGANNGTLVNGAWCTQGVSGKIGKAFEFTAANFGTGYDMGSGLQSGTSSWSASLWVKMINTIGRAYFIQWGADSGLDGLRVESDTTYHGAATFAGTSSSWSVTGDSSVDLSDGNWHHIVVVADRSGLLQIYTDTIAGSTSNISSISSDNISNSTNFTIIKNFGVATGVIVDEMGLWNRALTGTEISTLYNSGTGKSYPF